MNNADPLGMGITFIPINQTLKHQMILRLGFYQKSESSLGFIWTIFQKIKKILFSCFGIQSYQPTERNRTFHRVEGISFFNVEGNEDSQKVLGQINKVIDERVLAFLNSEFLKKMPVQKELISLKIKIQSYNLLENPLFKTDIKVDWIKNAPRYQFVLQLLDQDIIQANQAISRWNA